MGDVGRVASEQPRVDGVPYASDKDLAHLDAGFVVVRGGIKIGEWPGEHDLSQLWIRDDELAEGLGEVPKGLKRVLGRGKRRKVVAQHPESLEENLPDEARFVAEDFVDRRNGGVRAASNSPCGQSCHPLLSEQCQGAGHPTLVEGVGALFQAGHNLTVALCPRCWTDVTEQ